MQRWRRVGGLLVLTAVSLLWAPLPVSANHAKAKRISFGYVDLAQVTDQVKIRPNGGSTPDCSKKAETGSAPK